MKTKVLVSLILLGCAAMRAQPIQKDRTRSLVTRGTFFAGFSSNVAFGFVMPERSFVFPARIRPRIGYFVCDRLSISASYKGAFFIGGQAGMRASGMHAGEIELNHYFYARKNILLYSLAGVSVQRLGPGTLHPAAGNIHLKLGAGINLRSQKHPNLGFTIEAAYYLGQPVPGRSQRFPEICVGISYSFHRKARPLKKHLME